jgi:hypothetical protein
MPTTLLTPHFTLGEFTASQTAARLGVGNAPNEIELANLRRLAVVMEQVRTILRDKPILISSGYRSSEINRAVGGAQSSAHVSGLAVDFTCPGFGDPLTICRALASHMPALGIDQLIYEFASWVHLGLPVPRLMQLTIDSAGTRNGF